MTGQGRLSARSGSRQRIHQRQALPRVCLRAPRLERGRQRVFRGGTFSCPREGLARRRGRDASEVKDSACEPGHGTWVADDSGGWNEKRPRAAAAPCVVPALSAALSSTPEETPSRPETPLAIGTRESALCPATWDPWLGLATRGAVSRSATSCRGAIHDVGSASLPCPSASTARPVFFAETWPRLSHGLPGLPKDLPPDSARGTASARERSSQGTWERDSQIVAHDQVGWAPGFERGPTITVALGSASHGPGPRPSASTARQSRFR
jgi:hypothetical protein